MSPSVYRVVLVSVAKHSCIASAIANHPRFEIVAVAEDASQPGWVHKRNQAWADSFEVPYSRNLLDAFRTHSAQVAVIDSEAARRCDLASQSIASDMHVIVDNPLSTRLGDCERLIATLKRNPSRRCLVWNRSFSPAIEYCTRQVQAGEVGRIQSIHCDFFLASKRSPPNCGPHSNGGSNDASQGQLDERGEQDEDPGDSALGELQAAGCYPLAYLHRISGGLGIRKVFARTSSRILQSHQDNHAEDLASVSLELEGGVIGSLCLGRAGSAGHPSGGVVKLHVIGDNNALIVQDQIPEALVHCHNQPLDNCSYGGVANDNDHLLLENFLDAIENGASLVLDASTARDFAAVIEACLRSANGDRLIEVN